MLKTVKKCSKTLYKGHSSGSEPVVSGSAAFSVVSACFRFVLSKPSILDLVFSWTTAKSRRDVKLGGKFHQSEKHIAGRRVFSLRIDVDCGSAVLAGFSWVLSKELMSCSVSANKSKTTDSKTFVMALCQISGKTTE